MSGPANVGGCALVTIDSAQIVAEATPASSCTIQYDADGDSLADGLVQVGARYEANTSFTAFCDPPALGAENSISLLRA